MYQHSHCLHAEVLHVPLLRQVPQKPHRGRLLVLGSQGMLVVTFIVAADFVT